MTTIRRSILAALAALVVVAAPASTHAAETYLALKGGVWVPTASDGYGAINDSLSSISAGKFPASGDIELAYGATMGIIGAQIAGGYMWSTATDSAGNKVSANAVPLYAVGQLRLPIFFIQPYLELGIGGLANFANATVGGQGALGHQVLVPRRRRRGRGLHPRTDPARCRGPLHVRHRADLRLGSDEALRREHHRQRRLRVLARRDGRAGRPALRPTADDHLALSAASRMRAAAAGSIRARSRSSWS